MPACRDMSNMSQKQALLIRDYPTEKRILNIAMNLDLFFSAEEAPQQQKMALCDKDAASTHCGGKTPGGGVAFQRGRLGFVCLKR